MDKLYQIFLKQKGLISKDTRTIQQGAIYFALKGENFNGNLFVQPAFESGASYAVVDEQVDIPKRYEAQLIRVNDVLKTLQNLANHHRKQFDIPVLGITGSNGKTTTKELIHAVLDQKYKVVATEGNLNNHIGVPLTLLRIQDSTELAIIEMGANQPGDIHELAEIAEPNAGLITNIGKAHLEGLGGEEGVLKTKRALYDFVIKYHGSIYYNTDDPVIKNLVENYDKKINYGSSTTETFVSGVITQSLPTLSIAWQRENKEYTLKTNLSGDYNLQNILSAICIGIDQNVSAQEVNTAIEGYQPFNNRSQVEKSGSNTILWDAYNANPTSMENAISTLVKADGDKKLAIIGDMKELGEDAKKEHQKILALLNQEKIAFMSVGEIFGQLNAANFHFENVAQLNEYLAKNKPTNSTILIKGSRSIALEKVAEYL